MPIATGLYYFAHETTSHARPPVVLIHGAGGSHLSWPPQLRRLPEHRVYAPDLPGHGKSAGVGHQSIDDYLEDVLAFLSNIGIYSAIWVGHSMGSAVALKAALRCPDRVRALALLGGGARLRVAPSLLRGASDPTTFEGAVRTLGEKSFSPSSARIRELALQRLQTTRPAVLYGDLMACDAFNVTGDLPRISVPTLVVCGMEDRMMPQRY